ncbi:MAG: serine aminopeptidase domain-containing protein, partial [Nitrospiraceae bacterium]
GLYLTLNRAIPVGEHQPVHLGFVSDIAVLNIQGRVRGVRENIRPGQEQDEGSSLGLAIEFPTLGATEGPIFASLLEELRERPGSVKVTAFLVPREARDLLLEMSSGEDGTLQLTALRSRPEASSESPSINRRLAPRVNLALAAQLEGWTEALRFSPHTALTANLSMGGVSLRLEAHENLIGRRCYVRLPTLHATAPGRGNGEGANSSFTVLTEVVWVQPDCSPLSELRTVSAAPTLRAGLRFVYLNDENYRLVAKLVGQFLTTPLRLHQRDKAASVNSEFLTCRNEKGQRIALYYDHPRERLESHSPVAIISSGYGDTKRDHVTLAYYLARNGFHVLRYDHTDHVGESEGDIADFTLTGMEHDLSAVLDFAGQRWPTAPTMVVATNVAGRVALKHATRDPRIQLLVLIACVVDLRATLHAVHREDLLGAHRAGIRRGTANLLGFTNHRDFFLDDAIVHGYSDLETTIRDAEHVQTPVILLGAEKDSWVTLESLKQVQLALGANSKHFFLVPQGAHHLSENANENGSVLRQVLNRCIAEFTSPSNARVLIEVPRQEITVQYQLERERARAHHPMDKAQLVEFWREYLHHSQDMINASDFWQLLDQLYRLPGVFKEEEKILDAGCGGGNFGMYLLTNQAYQRRNRSDVSQGLPSYVGIDFVPEALAQAHLNLTKVTQQLRESAAFPLTVSSPIKVSFNLTDLNYPLPFHDNQFDRIVCNLVVAYLHNPLLTLREFMRVLVPKGLLILTNLKPHADIFQIYRAIIRMKSPDKQEEPAKALLSNFGKIIQGERNGVFRFFGREELSTLLSSIGAVRSRIHTTFADQAYLAVAEKPVS